MHLSLEPLSHRSLYFQLFYKWWRISIYVFWWIVIVYSMVVLILIYTYQFEQVQQYWQRTGISDEVWVIHGITGINEIVIKSYIIWRKPRDTCKHEACVMFVGSTKTMHWNSKFILSRCVRWRVKIMISLLIFGTVTTTMMALNFAELSLLILNSISPT